MTEKLCCTRIFAELHWAVRRPNFTVHLNSVEQTPEIEWLEKISDNQENTIFRIYAPLEKNNVLDISMRDKSDSDILEVNGNWTEHAVFIREIEIDGVKFEMSLFRHSEFRHLMPHEWVKSMAERGINIEPFYANCTDMRLNGTVTVKFQSPVWRWVTEDLAKIWNEDGCIH